MVGNVAVTYVAVSVANVPKVRSVCQEASVSPQQMVALSDVTILVMNAERYVESLVVPVRARKSTA